MVFYSDWCYLRVFKEIERKRRCVAPAVGERRCCYREGMYAWRIDCWRDGAEWNRRLAKHVRGQSVDCASGRPTYYRLVALTRARHVHTGLVYPQRPIPASAPWRCQRLIMFCRRLILPPPPTDPSYVFHRSVPSLETNQAVPNCDPACRVYLVEPHSLWHHPSITQWCRVAPRRSPDRACSAFVSVSVRSRAVMSSGAFPVH